MAGDRNESNFFQNLYSFVLETFLVGALIIITVTLARKFVPEVLNGFLNNPLLKTLGIVGALILIYPLWDYLKRREPLVNWKKDVGGAIREIVEEG